MVILFGVIFDVSGFRVHHYSVVRCSKVGDVELHYLVLVGFSRQIYAIHFLAIYVQFIFPCFSSL